MKLFTEAEVAIDGSEFKAVNNRDRNFTEQKTKSRLAHLEKAVMIAANSPICRSGPAKRSGRNP